MSDLKAPMTNLFKKDVPWNWDKECQSSFQRFKEILTSDLCLTHYLPNTPIQVAADASSLAIGAQISHEFPDGSIKAIAYASRMLTPAERKYSQIEREALGLVFAVKKFHRYIYGQKFTLLADHKPLLGIFGSKKGIAVHSAVARSPACLRFRHQIYINRRFRPCRCTFPFGKRPPARRGI